MSAAGIAAALGKARREGRGWRCRCPVHGGSSLTLRDGRDALLVRCWAGCETADVLAELRRLGVLGDVTRDYHLHPAPANKPTNNPYSLARRIELARSIWIAAKDARGSPVEGYLAGRGITMPPPRSLRWAPSLRRPDDMYSPAMLARVDGLHGDLIAVHRTYLERHPSGVWRRRDRASLGPVGGGAARLAPAGETLLVAEGIETALAAMQATTQPAWAALSAGGIEALLLPPTAREIIILADHDRNGAGERAARTAAQRWRAEGRRVRIAMPPEPGTDFADVLAGRIAGVCDAAA